MRGVVLLASFSDSCQMVAAVIGCCSSGQPVTKPLPLALPCCASPVHSAQASAAEH